MTLPVDPRAPRGTRAPGPSREPPSPSRTEQPRTGQPNSPGPSLRVPEPLEDEYPHVPCAPPPPPPARAHLPAPQAPRKPSTRPDAQPSLGPRAAATRPQPTRPSVGPASGPRRWRLLRPGPAHAPSGPRAPHTRVTATLKGAATRGQRCRTRNVVAALRAAGPLPGPAHSRSTQPIRHPLIPRPRLLRDDASTQSRRRPAPWVGARRVPGEHVRRPLPGP